MPLSLFDEGKWMKMRVMRLCRAKGSVSSQQKLGSQKIASLQRDRKSKVNKTKNVIISMKEFMQNDENSSKVYSLLETL